MMPRMRHAIPMRHRVRRRSHCILTVVGVLLMLHQRWIVVDTVSLGTGRAVAIAGGGRRVADVLSAGRPLLGSVLAPVPGHGGPTDWPALTVP